MNVRLAWRRARRGAQGTVGVGWPSGATAVAHVVPGDPRPSLVRCELLGETPGALRTWVDEQQLAGTACVLVPPPDSCVLRVIDAPDVPREELAASARWLVQDLVDFDVDDAWVDVLEIPVAAGWTRARKLYVAVGRADRLTACVRMAREAGLRPSGFEITERALLRLAAPESSGRGVAVLELSPKGGLLAIGEGAELHVTRALHFDPTPGPEEEDPQAIDLDGEDLEPPPPGFGALLLDLQRSLDYFESEFGRSPAARIAIAPSEEDHGELAVFLSENLRLPTEVMDLRETMPGPAQPELAMQARCLEAIGAALAGPGLFATELAPRPRARGSVNAFSMLRVSGLVAVIGLLQFALEHHQATRLERQVETLREQQGAVQRRLTGFLESAEPEPLSVQQQARLRALETERTQRLRLLEALATHGSAPRSFAGVASALAREPVEGLWITSIAVRLGGRELELHGRAGRAELVPRLLEQMEGQPELRGLRFERVEISRPENGGLAFVLGAVGAEGATP